MDNIIASNGYIEISYIKYDTDDYVVLSDNKECLIQYDNTGLAYFIYNNIRYNLGEFIRAEL